MALTDLKIKKAKAKEKPYKLYDSLGLFVLVKPNGSKLWRQKYQLDGKERTIAHGSYPVVSLRDARNKRDVIRDQIAAGNDPAVQKRLDQIEAETQARNTFLLVAEEYLQMAYDRELADATMRKKIWHVHTLAEELHHRPVGEITSAEILHLLKKVEHSGRRETAKKLSHDEVPRSPWTSAVFRLCCLISHSMDGSMPLFALALGVLVHCQPLAFRTRDFRGWRVARRRGHFLGCKGSTGVCLIGQKVWVGGP